MVAVLLTRVVTPETAVVAAATEMTGVEVPVATAIGAVPVTLVTVPPGLETQTRPLPQREQAERICPSVPTVRADGVADPVPVTIAPLPVIVEQGMAVDAAAGETQARPVEQVAHATSSWPSVPTVRAEGDADAVPVTIAPLPVMVEQGMAVPPEFGVQQSPVAAAAHATRI